MFNDLANQFGCSQQSCMTIPGQTGGPFIYTVCQFDQPRPTGVPYVVSTSTTVGCTNSTCSAPKSTCYNGVLCCKYIITITCINLRVFKSCALCVRIKHTSVSKKYL